MLSGRCCLITGGLGFLGSHLADRLIAEGCRVRIVDRVRSSPRDRRGARRHVEIVEGALEDPSLLTQSLSGVDYVLHLAWSTVPKSSNDDPAFDVVSNVVASQRLWSACAAEGVSRVVFISSGGTVYGVPRIIPIPETHPTDPLCSYGITKLAAEKYLQLLGRTAGLSHIILRISNLYGEGQRPHKGQGAVSVFLHSIAAGTPISVMGDGLVVRDFLYVGDAVEAILSSLRCTTDARVMNLGTGIGTSLRQLLMTMAEVTGVKQRVAFGESRPFDVPANVLDARLAERELDWRPRVDLPEGLEQTWNWVRSTAMVSTSV